MFHYEYIFVFILGISIGSFINVILFRYPKNISVIDKRSHCFTCKRDLSWIDNIPIFSWIFLRGRCRSCNSKISIQYPLIEIFSGIAFLLITLSESKIFPLMPYKYHIISSWFLFTIFLPLIILDLRYLWLPSSLNYLGSLFGLILISFYSFFYNKFLFFDHFLFVILICLSISVLYLLLENIYQKKVIGYGDLKLFLMLGILLGYKGLFITIYLSIISCGIFSLLFLWLKKLKKSDKIPFGPFILISSSFVWFLGEEFFLGIYTNFSNLFINILTLKTLN